MTTRTARRTSMLFVIAMALTTAGVGAQSMQPGDTTDPRITDGSAKKALVAARAKWKKANIRNYQVRVALGCFCPEDIRKPRTIKVRGSLPVKPPQHLKNVASVNRMYQVISGAITRGVAKMSVSYGKYGVPKSIRIDFSEMIADEESYYTIDRFKRAK